MSDIEWTNKTWNPMVGCSKISGGCDHCYAITMAARLQPTLPHYRNIVGAGDWSGVINRSPPHIFDLPLHTRTPAVWFVNSMSDMFHEHARDQDIIDAFKIMNDCPQHIFQVLTKRPSRMAKKTEELGLVWSDNIWAGSTIEDDKFAKPRLRELLKVTARTRFISAEPLIGPLPSLDVSKVDWVIVGGESGIKKTVRKMERQWAIDLAEACFDANTPFFFKQWGKFDEDGVKQRSKAMAGKTLAGLTIHQMPAAVFDQLHRMGQLRPTWSRGGGYPMGWVFAPAPAPATRSMFEGVKVNGVTTPSFPASPQLEPKPQHKRKVEPVRAKYRSIDGFKNELAREHSNEKVAKIAPPAIDGEKATTALRQPIIDFLTVNGPATSETIRATTLNHHIDADREMVREARWINYHAFALKYLVQAGKIINRDGVYSIADDHRPRIITTPQQPPSPANDRHHDQDDEPSYLDLYK